MLAIDLGLKRTGLAVTDPARIIASALDTVSTNELLAYLTRYLAPLTLFRAYSPIVLKLAMYVIVRGSWLQRVTRF